MTRRAGRLRRNLSGGGCGWNATNTKVSRCLYERVFRLSERCLSSFGVVLFAVRCRCFLFVLYEESQNPGRVERMRSVVLIGRCGGAQNEAIFLGLPPKVG